MSEITIDSIRLAQFFDLPGIGFNQLQKFSSYTYQLSVGAVNKKQFNDASYMENIGGQDQRWLVIGESGYTGIKPTAETAGTGNSAQGSRVITASGIPEFYIDNLKITINMPGTGNSSTGLVGGSFDVFEPYSLGQLFESLLASAQLAGYTHFTNCPYVLKIEYKGYDDAGQPVETITGATRYFPIAFNDISFAADGSGSQYTCKFMQANDQYMVNSYTGNIESTFNFAGAQQLGATLANISIQMNLLEKQKIKEGKKSKEEQYVFEYVNSSNIEDSKKIKWANEPEIQYDGFTAGNPSYYNPDDLEATGKLQLFARESRFNYSSTKDKKLNIIQILDDVMCHTNIATEAIRNMDKDGTTVWWAINKRSEFLDPNGGIDPVTGLYPLKYFYTIRPYQRRLDVISKPGANFKDGDRIRQTIKRAYSYTYTGENSDIIDFKMEYNVAFFIAGQPRGWDDMKENDGKIIKTETGFILPTPASSENALAVVPGTFGYRSDSKSFPTLSGGNGIDTPELAVARWAHTALTGVTNGDEYDPVKSDYMQLKLNLKIVGDPYFMPIGGMGNQNYLDQGMAWQGQEVRVFMAFKTIVDYPNPGSSLPKINSTEYHPFSGVYRIVRAIHNFNDGVYTTNLLLTKDLATNNQMTRRDRSDVATTNNAESGLLTVLQADFDKRSDLEGLNLDPKGSGGK